MSEFVEEMQRMTGLSDPDAALMHAHQMGLITRRKALEHMSMKLRFPTQEELHAINERARDRIAQAHPYIPRSFIRRFRKRMLKALRRYHRSTPNSSENL